jgi:hypothetical protein
MDKFGPSSIGKKIRLTIFPFVGTGITGELYDLYIENSITSWRAHKAMRTVQKTRYECEADGPRPGYLCNHCKDRTEELPQTCPVEAGDGWVALSE